MDYFINAWNDYLQDLIKHRDQELDRLIFGNLSEKDLYELKGSVCAHSRMIEKVESILKEYFKKSDLPRNIRILEENLRKYNLNFKNTEQ